MINAPKVFFHKGPSSYTPKYMLGSTSDLMLHHNN
jgi:hypothetical protein